MTDNYTPSPKLFDAIQHLKSEGYSGQAIAALIDVMLFNKVSKIIEVFSDPRFSEGEKQLARIIYKTFQDADVYYLETFIKIIDGSIKL